MTNHQDWEETAAGHALGALEPDDEQRFEAHLRTCAQCQQVIDETEAVMAELGFAAEQDAAPPQLKGRLMAAIHEDADDEPRMGVVSQPDALEILRGRHRSVRKNLADRWVRYAAAASVVLLAVIAIGVWARGGGTSVQQPQFVALQSQQKDVATVELLGRQAWVIPTGIADNDSSNSQYVLWSVPAQGSPVAVAGFDVVAGHAVVQVGEVRQTLQAVSAFAISKEPGRTLPAAPTDIVAKGAVSWPYTQALRTFD